MRQTRECNNPAPAHGGQNCAGDSEQTKTCEIKKCVPSKYNK